MTQTDKKRKRTDAVRQCQAKRRENLKSLTVEVNKDMHSKVKSLAEHKKTTVQGLLFDTLSSMVDTEVEGSRPWSVFDTLRAETDCARTHVSLFSGCGGADLGFRQAGFKTIFANDINADACATYRENLGDITEGDVRAVSLPSLPKHVRLDVLSAGFPCQPFSNAGSRRGVEDDRGTLYQAALNAVKTLKPRAVLFENVRGLLSFKNEKRLLIEEICENLDDLDYDVVFSLVDASKHHVPQRRLRVVIVGVERSRKTGRFSFPTPVERNDLSIGHTILDLAPDALNQGELMQLNPQALHIGAMVPEGGSWKSIDYDELPDRLKRIADNIERYRWPNFYRRFHRNEVAGTITAAFKPENAGVWHPVEQRIFSVREIARIQSFPDWFGFHGKTVKSKYQQIGNAIPPRLAYEIALNIGKALDGEDLRSDAKNGEEYLTFDQFVKTGKPLRACDRDIVFSDSDYFQKKKGTRGRIMTTYLNPKLVETSFRRLAPKDGAGKGPMERTSALMYFLAFDATMKKFGYRILDLNYGTPNGKTNRAAIKLEFAKLVLLKPGSDRRIRQVSVLGAVKTGDYEPEKRISSNFLTTLVKKASESAKPEDYPNRPAPLLKMGGAATGVGWGIDYHDKWRDNLPKFLAEVRGNTPFTDLAVFVFRNAPLPGGHDNLQSTLSCALKDRFSENLAKFWSQRMNKEKILFTHGDDPFSNVYQESLTESAFSTSGGVSDRNVLQSLGKETLIDRVVRLETLLAAYDIEFEV